MTRKRFIKLSMSAGFSRNKANLIAWCCRQQGFSYSKYYDRYLKPRIAFSCSCKKLNSSFSELEKTAKKAAESFKLMLENIKGVIENESKNTTVK